MPWPRGPRGFPEPCQLVVPIKDPPTALIVVSSRVISKKEVLAKQAVISCHAQVRGGAVYHVGAWTERQKLRKAIPTAEPKNPHSRGSAIAVDERMYSNPFSMQPRGGIENGFHEGSREHIWVPLRIEFVQCQDAILEFRNQVVDFCGNLACPRRRQPADCRFVVEERWMSASSKRTSVGVVRYQNPVNHLAVPAENHICGGRLARRTACGDDADRDVGEVLLGSCRGLLVIPRRPSHLSSRVRVSTDSPRLLCGLLGKLRRSQPTWEITCRIIRDLLGIEFIISKTHTRPRRNPCRRCQRLFSFGERLHE